MLLEEAINLLGSPAWSQDFGAYCETLKKNFRKLIMAFHGDKAKETKETEEMARKIIEANSVIKQAIDSGQLKSWLKLKVHGVKQEEKKYTSTQWDAGLSEEVDSVTDTLIKTLGSMKALLMSLPNGYHSISFRGLCFSVKCHVGSQEVYNGETARVWEIDYASIRQTKELPSNVDPIRLIFQP